MSKEKILSLYILRPKVNKVVLVPKLSMLENRKLQFNVGMCQSIFSLKNRRFRQILLGL